MDDLQAFFEEIPLIAVLLRDGVIVSMTHAAVRLFGNRLLNRPLSELLPEHEASMIAEAAAQGQNLALLGVPAADGYFDLRSVYFAGKAWLILDPHQSVGELSTTFSPMNCSSLSQAIRSPLIPMISAVSLLSRRLIPAQDDKSRRQFSFLSQNCLKLLRLSNNLTELSQYAAGKMTLYLQERDLNAFAAETLDAAVPFADVRELKLRFEGLDTPLVMAFDELKVERLLFNLLSNALKHTPAGGHITLSVSSDSTYAYLRVSDNGSGITSEQLMNLFHTYSMGQSSGQSLGLGLSLVRMIAELHGGAVILESRPDKGTVVTVSLRRDKKSELPLRSRPVVDYTGEFPHALVELSDSIPGGHPLYDLNGEEQGDPVV